MSNICCVTTQNSYPVFMTNTMTRKQERKAAILVARDAMLEGRTDDAMACLLQVMSRDQAERELAPAPEPKIGDILYASWGYDQTNIDYYQVVAVTKSSVRIREIGKRYAQGDHFTQVSVTPVVGQFVDENVKGELHRVRKTYKGIGYAVTLDTYKSAWLWDGKARNETAAGYGH